jgi:formate dehydrogenase assembly factor FdhD
LKSTSSPGGFTSMGFVYSEALIKRMRDIAAISQETHAAAHLIHRSLVFLNPIVLSKP